MKNKNASMIFIFVTVLVDVIGLGVIIPIMPDLIEELTGGTVSDASYYAGWLTFAYAAMQFLFAPVLGELSDQYGRKPLLIMGLFGLGLDYVFHALAPTLIWLFVGRILAGICGASFTVANAYVADISKPEDKAKNFGFVGAAFGLGFIIGPLIGGVFAEWGVRVPFYIAAGLSLTNMLYGLIMLPESLAKEKRRKFDWKKVAPGVSIVGLKRYPLLVGMMISFFLIHIAGHALQSTWTFFTKLKFGWDPAEIGYSLALVGLLVVGVQAGLVGFLTKRFGNIKTIYAGYILWTLGMMLFAFAEEGWMLYIFLVPYCIGGIAGPTLQGIVSNQVPENEQGELQGGMTGVISMTAIFGPLLMTNIFTHFTDDNALAFFPGAPFIAGSVLMLLGFLFAFRALQRFGDKTPPPGTSDEAEPTPSPVTAPEQKLPGS